MKKQSSRARAQSTPIVRHQLEHPVPTVIHDPEEKMTALGRLAHHAMLEPRRYLGWPLAIIGGLIVAAIAWRMANNVTSNESEVWTKLEAARTPSGAGRPGQGESQVARGDLGEVAGGDGVFQRGAGRPAQ